MSTGAPFDRWRDELLFVGRIVQDGEPVPQPEAERRCERYIEMLDALDGTEGPEYVLAVIESIQVDDDYEVYQRAFAAFDRFSAEQRYAALLHELPRLIRLLPDQAGDLLLGNVQDHDAHVFNALLADMPHQIRDLIRNFIRKEECDGWLSDSKGLLG